MKTIFARYFITILYKSTNKSPDSPYKPLKLLTFIHMLHSRNVHNAIEI